MQQQEPKKRCPRVAIKGKKQISEFLDWVFENMVDEAVFKSRNGKYVEVELVAKIKAPLSRIKLERLKEEFK